MSVALLFANGPTRAWPWPATGVPVGPLLTTAARAPQHHARLPRPRPDGSRVRNRRRRSLRRVQLPPPARPVSVQKAPHDRPSLVLRSTLPRQHLPSVRVTTPCHHLPANLPNEPHVASGQPAPTAVPPPPENIHKPQRTRTYVRLLGFLWVKGAGASIRGCVRGVRFVTVLRCRCEVRRCSSEDAPGSAKAAWETRSTRSCPRSVFDIA